MKREATEAEKGKEVTTVDDRPRALTSHELAELLNKRRDNDIMVEVTDDGLDTITAQPFAIMYNSGGDQVVILARRYYD